MKQVGTNVNWKLLKFCFIFIHTFFLIFIITSNLSFFFFCKTLETKNQLAARQQSNVFFSFNLLCSQIHFPTSFFEPLFWTSFFESLFFNLFFQPLKKTFINSFPQIYHNPHNLMKVFSRIDWQKKLRKEVEKKEVEKKRLKKKGEKRCWKKRLKKRGWKKG